MIKEKTKIQIGGLMPLTSIDYPGELSAVVFCQGCTWNCPYCHNKHLQSCKQIDSKYTWDYVKSFLEKRKNWLSAVVFSGGEPTLQDNLVDAIKEVKSMGFKIGLHTNGFNSDKFAKILPLCDWIGFDIKHFFDYRYDEITGIKNSFQEVFKSFQLLLNSGKACEFRITQNPNLIDNLTIKQLQDYLQSEFKVLLKIQNMIKRE